MIKGFFLDCWIYVSNPKAESRACGVGFSYLPTPNSECFFQHWDYASDNEDSLLYLLRRFNLNFFLIAEYASNLRETCGVGPSYWPRIQTASLPALGLVLYYYFWSIYTSFWLLNMFPTLKRKYIGIYVWYGIGRESRVFVTFLQQGVLRLSLPCNSGMVGIIVPIPLSSSMMIHDN